MNYIFDKDEYQKSNIDVFESNYMVEYLNFSNKEWESLNNSLKQLNGFELPQNESIDVLDNGQKYEAIWEKANHREQDSESVSSLLQKEILSNSDLISNPINLTWNDEVHNLGSYGLPNHCDNSREESIDKTKESTLNLNSDGIKLNAWDLNEKDAITNITDDKNESEESTFNHIEQLKYLTKTWRRNRMCGYYRWNRKDDIKMFSELRKLCKQSNIDENDFCDTSCFISDQHQDILDALVNKINWRRDADTMLKRIRTLSKKQTLSVRQIETLRRLSHQAMLSNEKLTADSIIDMFPGKSTATLMLYINQITKSLLA